MSTRRTFLKVLGGGAVGALVGLPTDQSMAEVAASQNTEFFIFIHASGGWDVTLWADPRNELKGLMQPASTENTDTAQIKKWVDAPLDGSEKTFELIRPANSSLVFGPGIGELSEMPDRITIVNGLSMNTVAHPDGSVYSATGRHPQGGRVAASSIDTMLSNEFGKEQLLPTVSMRFPSSFVGDSLDRRVVPLVIDDVDGIGNSLSRSESYDSDEKRDKVTVMLSEEAKDIAKRTRSHASLDGMGVQYNGLRRMLSSHLKEVFSKEGLKKAHPEFDYKSKFASKAAVQAAFAVEAMKRDLVRSVSFTNGSFDTHTTNYRNQAALQQDTFNLIATLIKVLDATPHPTKSGDKLADHTHILVVSEFCRAPQINLAGGRDHHPNNSALVVSPNFKRNFVFGKSDPDQVLPSNAKRFSDGERAITPADLLATFLGAFKVDPRKYMRDGEVVPELLKA
jgi:Protein of unknown function (DUF1501)